MEIRILGPLQVVGGDGPLSLPGGRIRALVAVLALSPGKVVSTERLVDLLWAGTPPPTARTKLHGYVSALRKTLRGESASSKLVETRGSGYALGVDPDQVDSSRFRRLIREAATLPVPGKARLLHEALGLWRGPALADFTYEPFAQSEIVSLEELRLRAIEERIGADLELGRHAMVADELERLMSEHPFRERLRAHAMVALYRSGNQQRALGVYRDAYATFTEEMGIEPGRELRELEEQILNQDPTLTLSRSDGAVQTDDDPVEGSLLTESRRIVTVMYADLTMPDVGSADPEVLRSIALGARHAIADGIRHHGGTHQGSIGGVNVGVFGLPAANEDDPVRAVRAAIQIMRLLARGTTGGDRPEVRIGINTGEVVVGATGLGASGLPEATTTVAALLQKSALNGEVLIGDRTRRLVGRLATVEPVERPVIDASGQRLAAWRVVEVPAVAPGTSADLGDALIGREGELARLLAVLQEVVDRAEVRQVTIIGSAGIGKSRLAVELARSVGSGVRVVTGHCPPYGEGITFWPLREIVQSLAGGVGVSKIGRLVGSVEDGEAIARQVAAVLGTEDSEGGRDVFPSIRTFFQALARHRPLVLVFEDIHWAEPTLLDLISYLTEFLIGPVVLLCLARPELLDRRPGWDTGNDNVEIFNLPPLETEHVESLVELAFTGHGQVLDRAPEVVELAEGNPLFALQMLAALREEDEIIIPPSIRGLLLSRLDRLGPAEREVMAAASVLGRQFNQIELAHLLPSAVEASLTVHLDSLERKHLVARADSGFAFGHVLIQLVAYQTITKEKRAELHETVAQLLDSSAADGDRLDELIGYHLEQAYSCRAQLGLGKSHHGLDLARRAGAHLLRAGRRAFGVFDAMGAQVLLARALELLPADHADRGEAKRFLAETYQVMGQHDKSEQVLIELIEEVAGSGGDPTFEHFLRCELVWARIATGPDPIPLVAIAAETEEARQVFAAAGDEVGLAQVCRILVNVHLRRGEATEMEAVARQGLRHAARADSTREKLGAQWMYAIALEEGPRPAEECIRLCQDVVTTGDIENPGVVSSLAYFWAMTGDLTKARDLSARSLRILRENVRARRPLGGVTRRIADVELLAGDLIAGERILREALAFNQETRESDMIAQITAALSGVLLRRGEVGEAERFAISSQRHAPAEGVTSQAMWRSALARVVSTRAEYEKAEFLAREAVGMVPREMPNVKAGASAALGEVLLRAGRTDLGAEAMVEARELFVGKGNVSAASQLPM